MLRILVVEDSEWRIEQFRKWTPDDVRLVETRCGGRAIGTIGRSGRQDWAGIMLDHDLEEQAVNAARGNVDGHAVVRAIISTVDPATPILIHSVNNSGANQMKQALEQAGFFVTRIRMADLNETHFLDWLEEVRASQ